MQLTEKTIIQSIMQCMDIQWQKLYMNVRMQVSLSSITKNYLTTEELKILNNMVSGYFDFAEIQAMHHNPLYMADYIKHLDNVLKTTGEKILQELERLGMHRQSKKQQTKSEASAIKYMNTQYLMPVSAIFIQSFLRKLSHHTFQFHKSL